MVENDKYPIGYLSTHLAQCYPKASNRTLHRTEITTEARRHGGTEACLTCRAAVHGKPKIRNEGMKTNSEGAGSDPVQDDRAASVSPCLRGEDSLLERPAHGL